MNGIATPSSSRFLQLLRSAVICAALMTVLSVTSSWGMTDIYQLAEKTGSATDMTGSTQVYGPNASYTSSTTTYPIGFTFYFDKKPYTTFSPNTSGLMSLGTPTYLYPYSYYWPNLSTLSPYYPMITASWCYYGAPTSSGKVHYKLTGTAPSRVLTVEWNNVYTVNSTSYTGGTWQVKLYEGSNRIEFWYGPFTYASTYYFTVGIASSSTRYINVWGNSIKNGQYYTYPSGSYYTYRYPSSYPINTNTIFEFAPCDKNLDKLVGNVAEGGTAAMKSGDNLLAGKQVVRGNTTGFKPFAFDLPASPCEPWTYTVTFAGIGAADYAISPANGTVITDGMVPSINFTPQGVGERTATMTMKVTNGETFTYTLKAEGVSRMGRTGNISEGGTTAMKDGDNLLTNIDVARGSSRDLRPFTIRNTNISPTNKGLVNASVSFTLDDPNGQYAMRLESASTSEKGSSIQATTKLSTVLTPGTGVTPVITFAPTDKGTELGTGPQPATLTVVADGEQFIYLLNGYSVAPVAEFYFNEDRLIGSPGRLFVNTVSCVGEDASSGRFVIENINKVPVVINNIDVLMTENQVRQGTPPHPQQLDEYGRVISMNDYFLSTNSPIAPVPANALVQFPLTIQPGERKTYYLGYVAQRPGKRYARLFLHTNAVNFTGKDVAGYMPNSGQNVQPQEGIMVLEVYGQGVGSHLAKNADGELGGLSMLFNAVKVGQSTTSETWIHNTGDCDMRISKGDLRLVAGDVNDFELIDVLPNTQVDAKGDFILPPGGSDKITARFTPSRSGSRRASGMLKGNDSTLVIEGVSDRGIYALDFYGIGQAYLEARSIQLTPAVIDGSTSKGVVTLINASTESVVLTGAALTGPNIAEITPDPSKPWPAFPLTVKPGDKLNFGVLLTPATGSIPGLRSVSLEFTVSNGDPVKAQVSGIVGTRTIVANPASMFRNAMIPVGSFKREYAVITNAGTFPIHVDRVSIIGANAADYKLTTLGRLDIDPGESQFVEVTYTPTAAGASSAQIEIRSNATNGVQHIDLMGMGTGTSFLGNPSSNGTMEQNNGGAARSVVIGAASVVPNPTRNNVTVSYVLASDGMTEIGLYDLSGRLVQSLESRYANAGAQTLQADLSDLANGTYYITIRQEGNVSRQAVIVAR